jgi:hypothetical protein
MFPLLPPDASTFPSMWALLVAKGGTVGENGSDDFAEMTPFYAIWGSFTCCKSVTWGKRLYYPWLYNIGS